jgi:hypothetical protein
MWRGCARRSRPRRDHHLISNQAVTVRTNNPKQGGTKTLRLQEPPLHSFKNCAKIVSRPPRRTWSSPHIPRQHCPRRTWPPPSSFAHSPQTVTRLPTPPNPTFHQNVRSPQPVLDTLNHSFTNPHRTVTRPQPHLAVQPPGLIDRPPASPIPASPQPKAGPPKCSFELRHISVSWALVPHPRPKGPLSPFRWAHTPDPPPAGPDPWPIPA